MGLSFDPLFYYPPGRSFNGILSVGTFSIGFLRILKQIGEYVTCDLILFLQVSLPLTNQFFSYLRNECAILVEKDSPLPEVQKALKGKRFPCLFWFRLNIQMELLKSTDELF